MKSKPSLFSYYYHVSWYIFVLVCMLPSCTEESKILRKAERAKADSLILAQSKILGNHLDSICKADYEKGVQYLVDSMAEIRIKRIEEIINQ